MIKVFGEKIPKRSRSRLSRGRYFGNLGSQAQSPNLGSSGAPSFSQTTSVSYKIPDGIHEQAWELAASCFEDILYRKRESDPQNPIIPRQNSNLTTTPHHSRPSNPPLRPPDRLSFLVTEAVEPWSGPPPKGQGLGKGTPGTQ